MATKKTIKQAVEFAEARMRERLQTDPNWGSVTTNATTARLILCKTRQVQVDVNLDFLQPPAGKSWMPVVSVNAPAFNGKAAHAVAFAVLVQEATSFAATLQSQLDEFEIPSG